MLATTLHCELLQRRQRVNGGLLGDLTERDAARAVHGTAWLA